METKLKTCPDDIGFLTLDTVAECYSVGQLLYQKLWKLTAEAERAGKAQPLGGDGSNGTAEIPIVGGNYDNILKNAWDKFSLEEKKILVLATKLT